MLTGAKDLDTLVRELAELVSELVEGKQTKSEQLGHKEYLYTLQIPSNCGLACER